MKFRQLMFLSVILGAMSISQIATAVDGYKDLTFGMSKKQIMSKNICTLQRVESGQPGVEYYGCDDFMFGGEATEAGVFFINGKFLRFAIVPSIDTVLGLLEALDKKYGKASSSSTQKEIQAAFTLPNREAFFAYEKNTVFLKIVSDENDVQSAILLYSSPSYDVLLVKNQQESISGDL